MTAFATLANWPRARVLVLVLVASVLLALTQHTSESAGDMKTRRANDPHVELARLEQIRQRTPEIEAALAARQATWADIKDGMLLREPPAALLVTLSQTLSDLARDAGVDLGQPSVLLDSASEPRRVRARVTLHGEPDAIVFFLDTLSKHPQHVWTRALQLSRVPASATAPLTWTGTIDVESLVQPVRP